MITRLKSTQIICDDDILAGYVYFEDNKITAVTDRELPFDREIDCGDNYVSPGFIDIHTHGGGGFDFIKGKDEVIGACNFHASNGTTSICPTLSAAPISVMEDGIIGVKEAMESGDVKLNIIGVHMEGPYLSAAQCGGQCPDFITPPNPEDYRRLVREYPGIIARWSYAPENDEGGAFCKFITENGISATAGHTDAIYGDMQVAMANGCDSITHLYSCTSTITRDHGFRRLGVIETAMLHDELFVELICDGKHVPPELIRMTVKLKGCDRIAMITDSLSPAGLNITGGTMNATKFIIEDGVCKLLDRSAFAGSIVTSNRMIRVIRDEAGLSLTDAVKMLTKTPARLMKLNKGILAAGKDADIIVFDDNINITAAFVMGKQII